MTLGADEAVTVAAALMRAAKKSGRAWIGNRLVWCAWLDDALVLITGGPEQTAPDLTQPVTLADSTGAAALRLTTAATTLDPGSDQWETSARLLSERRLNGAGQPAELVTWWTSESVITRLDVVSGELR